MNAKWHPGSLAIDASAGYGKTEILCSRLLAMLLSDPGAAEHLVALTFTRAAAAEIYTRLLEMLVAALRDGDSLSELRRKLDRLVAPGAFDGVTHGELLALLRRLIDGMGTLNISTIDGFFYRLVRAFAIELGLPGQPALEPAGGDFAAAELLKELFSAAGGGDFASACRESRYGEEGKRLFDTCLELLSMAARHRSRRDDPDFWGGRFRRFAAPDPAKLAAALECCESFAWRSPKYAEKLRPLLAACAAARTGEHRFSRSEQETLRCFLRVWHDFPQEKPEGFNRGWEFPEPVASALRVLLDNGRNVLLHQCARRTAALRSLLKEYCGLYDRRMLRRGRIGFADLPQLLLEQPEDSGFLNEVQYRTNSRFRHFLVDEFQDTSREQWRVLEPMTGDNGEEDHSLFLVGDVKQALYGWRNGDSKLMGEVARDLEKRRLERSFRYGYEICEALNLLFGGVSGCSALPAPAAARWERVFAPHAPDERAARPGEFEVLALAPEHGADAEAFAKLAAALILDRLRKLGFFGSGLSGGVLVRSKRHGVMLRDALLELAPELADSVIWEGDESIANDPLVTSLLEFGVFVQHPAETLAGGTVGMNQLLRDLLPEDDESRLEWSSLIAERGVSGFLRAALCRIDTRAVVWSDAPPEGPWDPTDNGGVDYLLALAEEFDASGGARDMLRFRAVAANCLKPPAAVGGKLRLLTIHHSKGLTFDVVFHPMFDPAHGNWRNPDTSGLLPGGGTPDAPAWVLYRPREEGMTDPEVAAAVAARHADNCFEELCALYVALTRARRGMYVFLPPRGAKKRGAYHPEWKKRGNFSGRTPFAELKDASYYVSDLVFEAFFGDERLYPVDSPLPTERRAGAEFIRRAFGSPRPPERRPAPAACERLTAEFPPVPRRPGRAAPSHLEPSRRLYFALPRPDGGEMLGTRIHAFFERIGFWSAFTPPADTEAAILEHYRACAGNPGIVRLLDEPCELWRERSFDVLLDDGSGGRALVTGCFDRVQLYRDAAGRVIRAVIVDYKSNAVTPENLPDVCEHYRSQLETYRRALAALLGETPNLVGCRLIFTRLGEMRSL